LGQLALAWVLAKGKHNLFSGEDVFIIPGTRRLKYLTENNESINVNLTYDEI